jgi:hypothetical protein
MKWNGMSEWVYNEAGMVGERERERGRETTCKICRV